MTIGPLEIQILIIVFLSITVHEYAHAVIADAAGDPTPGIYGRVTLNPLAHFDKFGALMIIISSLSGFGFGWGKPVMVNPAKMRHPRRDHFWTVAGGPLSNFTIAALGAVLFNLLSKLVGLPPEVAQFLILVVIINCSLGLFNLLPIGPLDGMWLFGSLLPEKQRFYWTRFNLTYGVYIFLALVLIRPGGSSVFWVVLEPIHSFVTSRMLGH